MSKRKLSFIAVVCVLAGGGNVLKAQDKIVVRSVDSETSAWEIPLSDIRKITFSDTELKFVKTDDSYRMYVYPFINKITFDLSGSVDIKNDILLSGLSLYPNPATGYIRIIGWDNAEKETISIYSMNGELADVIEDWCGAPINVTSLHQGFYILKINNKILKFRKL